MNVLLVDDNDLECKCKKELDQINIGSLAFTTADLEKFDLIFYKGQAGTKLIRSRYTKTGKID